MTRKIIKIGDSHGITIPKDAMRQLSLKPGDKVVIEVDRKKQTVTVRRKEQNGMQPDKELVEWTDAFVEDYKDALNELAEK